MGIKPMKISKNLASFWSDRYFSSLDGLRAICILLVIFNHTKVPIPYGITGWLGVDIFFVLSGFLITTLLLRERDQYGNVSLKGFYVRRVFRILPIYFAVLASYFPIIYALHDKARWRDMKLALPYLLTFTQEFRPAASGTVYGQTWSLGYEEKFYLIWPLLLLLLVRMPKRFWGLAIPIGSLLLLLPEQGSRSYGGLFLGSVLAIVLDKGSSIGIAEWFARIPTTLSLALMAASYILVSLDYKLVLLFSLSTCFLVASLVLRQSWVRRLLTMPLIVLFGKRSYAMYLVHVVILDGIEKATRHTALYAWYVVVPLDYLVSFGVATGLYYLIEKPSVHYGRSVSKRLRQSKGSAKPFADISLIERPEQGTA